MVILEFIFIEYLEIVNKKITVMHFLSGRIGLKMKWMVFQYRRVTYY